MQVTRPEWCSLVSPTITKSPDLSTIFNWNMGEKTFDKRYYLAPELGWFTLISFHIKSYVICVTYCQIVSFCLVFISTYLWHLPICFSASFLVPYDIRCNWWIVWFLFQPILWHLPICFSASIPLDSRETKCTAGDMWQERGGGTKSFPLK